MYFNTTDKKTKIYSNSAWGDLGGGAVPGLLPNYTTTQRDALSPTTGQQIYNTTENKPQIYDAAGWKNVSAKLAAGTTCSLDGDCDSTHCEDGLCCATVCSGNCDHCNVAGSIGTCTNVASDCTGNCDICSSGNCAASNALCSTSTCTCTGSGTVFNCSSPAIGSSCQGGKIAYIDGTGLHGLIAALSDQSTGTTWGCWGTAISGADGTAIGTGHQNTHDMISAGCTNAAQVCHGVTINGYSDWYLPSKDELNRLYLNSSEIGGFTTGNYYSSSEFDSYSGRGQSIGSGFQGAYDKNTTNYVRAVRGF